MSGGRSIALGKDAFRNGVEDRGVFAEDGNVEDLLRIAEPEMFELGIEAGVF